MRCGGSDDPGAVAPFPRINALSNSEEMFTAISDDFLYLRTAAVDLGLKFISVSKYTDNLLVLHNASCITKLECDVVQASGSELHIDLV